MYSLNPFAHFQNRGPIVFYEGPYILSPKLVVFDSPLLYDADGNPIWDVPKLPQSTYKPFFPNEQFHSQGQPPKSEPRIIIGRFEVPIQLLVSLRR